MVDFRYYINRQGPRGQQGVKGEQGYSPQVTVGKNTASEFTLKVINEDGSFETENLKVVPENRGGTYVRYDKDTYQEYIGDPDIATTRTFGVVRLATKEDLGTQEESRALTSALLDTYLQENYLNKVNGDVVTGDVSFRGDAGFLNAPHIDKIKDELNNQYITRNVSNGTTEVGSLTVPDDITARMVQGGKEIAYTSDLTEFITNAVLNSAISNLVTLDTDQTITGKKTFGEETTFNGHTWTAEQEAVNLNVTSLATMKNVNVSGNLTSNGEINAVTINAAGIKNNQNNKYYLNQASITAGDNVTIEETTDGVKISSTGGGSSEPPANMVTTDTDQTITGQKTINDPIIASQYKYTAELTFATKVDNRTRIVSGIRVNEFDSRAITIGEAYNYKLVLDGTSVVDQYDKNS